MSEQNFIGSLVERYADDAAKGIHVVKACELHSTSKTPEVEAIFGISHSGYFMLRRKQWQKVIHAPI